MQRKTLCFDKGYRIAAEVRKAQAAEMVLAPGEAEGNSENYHRGSDQWLYIVSGTGKATIEAISFKLKKER